MASNFACIGFDLPDMEALVALVDEIVVTTGPTWTRGKVTVHRWEDPGSGARIVVSLRGKNVLGVLPSLASAPGATLGAVESLNERTCAASVLDDGDEIARLACEPEEAALLTGPLAAGGPASVVALANEVTVHEDADAFEESPDSLLGDDPGGARLAAASLIPVGLFGPADEADGRALMAGVVLHAEERTNDHGGGSFQVARVRTAGFEADVCLAPDEHPDPLEPGQVIAGDVYLIASIPAVAAGAGEGGRRRWFRRG